MKGIIAAALICFLIPQSAVVAKDDPALEDEEILKQEGFDQVQSKAITIIGFAIAVNRVCGESYQTSAEIAALAYATAVDIEMPENLLMTKAHRHADALERAIKDDPQRIMHVCDPRKK